MLDISERLGIPPMSVLPLRNYYKETEVELSLDILALLTVRQILRSVDLSLQDQRDRQRAQDQATREMAQGRERR